MKKTFKILTISLFILALGAGAEKFVIILSPSINPLILIKVTGEPKRGDYVIFKLDDPYFSDKPVNVTKRLACLAGDELATDFPWVYCNGELVATAIEKDKEGTSLKRFIYNGVIPEGFAVVLGDKDGSYDSRYWGFIELRNATKVSAIL